MPLCDLEHVQFLETRILVVSSVPFLCRASSPQVLASLSVKRGGHTLGAVSFPSGLSHQETPAGPVSVCMVSSVLQPYRWALEGCFLREAIEVQNTYCFQNSVFFHKICWHILSPPHLNSLVSTCSSVFWPCIWRTKELAQTHSDVK